jgi:hypothetical protein
VETDDEAVHGGRDLEPRAHDRVGALGPRVRREDVDRGRRRLVQQLRVERGFAAEDALHRREDVLQQRLGAHVARGHDACDPTGLDACEGRRRAGAQHAPISSTMS